MPAAFSTRATLLSTILHANHEVEAGPGHYGCHGDYELVNLRPPHLVRRIRAMMIHWGRIVIGGFTVEAIIIAGFLVLLFGTRLASWRCRSQFLRFRSFARRPPTGAAVRQQSSRRVDYSPKICRRWLCIDCRVRRDVAAVAGELSACRTRNRTPATDVVTGTSCVARGPQSAGRPGANPTPGALSARPCCRHAFGIPLRATGSHRSSLRAR